MSNDAPLRFGTAGLRGPMRDGPGGMNVATVTRATWAVARMLCDRGQAGRAVVVGRDTRHHSDEFAAATAEVFAAQGFSVILLPEPLPTPVLAYSVRHLGAAAGVQITASHNPAADNGYKLYLEGGLQIAPPTDREVEAAMAAAPDVVDIARFPVTPDGAELARRYAKRASSLRHNDNRVRVALTPLHGVGGRFAVDVLRRAGFDDVHTVTGQFESDPDFPTVAFPNPEEPGATDAVLALAAEIGADVAIALDPDADRCAVGIPTATGWRMLSGDETGWLLGDYVLSRLTPEAASGRVVASSVVSSQMLAGIADAYGSRYVETLTGFKWLARADADLPGPALVYAYEEAIGYCVDPTVVRDKDGISAAVLVCDLAAALKAGGGSVPAALDALARRHGVHLTSALTARVGDAPARMSRLRSSLPTTLGGVDVTTRDLATPPGPRATDALLFTGTRGDESVRLAVRPSGTEPKIKCYLETRVTSSEKLADARAQARARLLKLSADAALLLQRGPN
jgi:phosphomannomutase